MGIFKDTYIDITVQEKKNRVIHWVPRIQEQLHKKQLVDKWVLKHQEFSKTAKTVPCGLLSFCNQFQLEVAQSNKNHSKPHRSSTAT